MNEYSISDYGIFSDAVATTNDCSNKVTTAQDGVNTCKTVVSDQSVFMGPIQEKVVTVLTELDNNCTSIISNLNSMSSYLISTSSNYQTGDENANSTITNLGSLGDASLGALNQSALVTDGSMYSYLYNGKEFNVTNTKINVDDYAAYLQKNKIYQNAGFMGNQCMLLSQYFASDMLKGTYTSKDTMADHGGSPAVKMNEKVISGNVEPVMEYTYNELSQGNPVVLQVTQKKSNEGKRHLVTAVGYSSSVTSYQDLTPENILVLDCVDGKVQTLDERNRNYFNQGGNYQVLGPTEKFLTSIKEKDSNTVNA